MAEPASALRTRALGKRFGMHVALQSLDLSVPPGQFLTLFGPNGAGKTTLVRCLATLSHPSSGSVEIFGTPLEKTPPSVRHRVGVVSHASFLYGALTARENLAFYGQMFGVANPAQRAVEVARAVGIEDRLDDAVRTFSRGLLQRCSIARALVHEPDILLFDEPFSGLDPIASSNLSELLRQAHASGRTVVMTSHDLRRGKELADRVAILRNGRLVYDAASSDLSWEQLEVRYHELSRGGAQ